jgi:ankyrin repeat protein
MLKSTLQKKRNISPQKNIQAAPKKKKISPQKHILSIIKKDHAKRRFIRKKNYTEYLSWLSEQLARRNIYQITTLLKHATEDDLILFIANNIGMLRQLNSNRMSVVHLAAKHGNTPFLNIVLPKLKEVAPQAINAQDARWWWTPLHYALNHRQKAAAQCLIEHGARTDVNNKIKQNCLHLVISNNLTLIVEKILTSNLQTKNQQLIDQGLHLSRSLSMAKLLIQHGANIHNTVYDGCSTLHNAVKTGVFELVKFYVDNGLNVNSIIRGKSVLSLALEHHRRTGIAQYLISQGANVDLKLNKKTHLHLAIKNQGWLFTANQHNLIKLIIEKTQRIGAIDKDGNTALHLLHTRRYHPEIVLSLLLHGAPLNKKNKRGATPLEFACQLGTIFSIPAPLLLAAYELLYTHPHVLTAESTTLNTKVLSTPARINHYKDALKSLLQYKEMKVNNNRAIYPSIIHFLLDRIIKLVLQHKTRSLLDLPIGLRCKLISHTYRLWSNLNLSRSNPTQIMTLEALSLHVAVKKSLNDKGENADSAEDNIDQYDILNFQTDTLKKYFQAIKIKTQLQKIMSDSNLIQQCDNTLEQLNQLQLKLTDKNKLISQNKAVLELNNNQLIQLNSQQNSTTEITDTLFRVKKYIEARGKKKPDSAGSMQQKKMQSQRITA